MLPSQKASPETSPQAKAVFGGEVSAMNTSGQRAIQARKSHPSGGNAQKNIIPLSAAAAILRAEHFAPGLFDPGASARGLLVSNSTLRL